MAKKGTVNQELQEHPEFLAALQKNRKALAAYEAFSHSHKREYVNWINEAKRDETRAKRIAQTVEWLSEGKDSHE